MPPIALERVGKVAASTASDLYLCQHLLVFLKYSDVCRWTVAFGLYGGKVAGSAATDDAMWSGGLVIYIYSNLFKAVSYETANLQNKRLMYFLL